MEQDDEKALKWFRRAALEGLSRSQVAVGMMYFRGEGTEHCVSEALKWFRLAAEHGESIAEELVQLVERMQAVD